MLFIPNFGGKKKKISNNWLFQRLFVPGVSSTVFTSSQVTWKEAHWLVRCRSASGYEKRGLHWAPVSSSAHGPPGNSQIFVWNSEAERTMELGNFFFG